MMTDREWFDDLANGTYLWIDQDERRNYHIHYLGHAAHAVIEVFVTDDIARVTAFIEGFKSALAQVNGEEV